MLEHQRMDVAARAPHTQERPRRNHNRHLEFRRHATNQADIGRVGACRHRNAFHHAKHRRNRKTERMEHRQKPKEHIFGPNVYHACALLDVAHQVEMREFNSLRRPFGTGTENNRRHIVNAHLLEEPGFEIPDRQKHHAQEVQYKRRLFHVLLAQIFHVINFVIAEELPIKVNTFLF